MERKKIVLDADVLIHFAKAGYLNVLPSILPEYEHIVLSVVYDEVRSIQQQLDNQIEYLKNLRKLQFEPTREMRREYAMLTSRFGRGESACMAYCKFTDDVIGSSNLKDIQDYCNSNDIKYLTTLDFLHYAYCRKILTKEQCNEFITAVREKGSKLPLVDIATYNPRGRCAV